MQTPFPPANATPGAHSAPWTISLEINPLQAWLHLPPSPPSLAPRSAIGVKATLLRVLRPAAAGPGRASSVERGSSGNEVDSGLRRYSLGAWSRGILFRKCAIEWKLFHWHHWHMLRKEMSCDENIVEWTRILRESRAYQSFLNTSAAYILNNIARDSL